MARPASASHTGCGCHRPAVAEAPWDRSPFASENLFMTSPVVVAWYSLFSAGAVPQSWEPLMWVALPVLVILGVILLCELMGMRYIPNNRVGIIEKLWSPKGSVSEGRIIALNGEAGLQSDLLRGGVHFGFWRWQYRIHKVTLVTVPQGKIGYIYARDGQPLQPSQTLARVVPCNNFQDARSFLGESIVEQDDATLGQRGRQRAILREGVYAINLALFVVICEDAVYRLNVGG